MTGNGPGPDETAHRKIRKRGVAPGLTNPTNLPCFSHMHPRPHPPGITRWRGFVTGLLLVLTLAGTGCRT